MPDQEQIDGLHPQADKDRPRLQIPRGYRRGKCRSCGQLIFWATKVDFEGQIQHSPRTGRPIMDPIDPWPVSSGSIVLRGAGKAENVPVTVFHDGDRWQSHFRSCPEPQRFSGRARGRGR